MKTFVQKGDVLDAIAPTGGVVSGNAYLIAKAFGSAAATAAEGETFALVVEGVVNLPKATGAITQFATVYWDDVAKNVTTTATSNTKIGYATAAQISADTTVNVKLIPAA
jgi:predicted RecA/RadA family phage recombinase